MTRWVVGSLVGALAIAPLGFSGVTQEVTASIARVLFAVLLAAAIAFLGLAVVWNRRWAV